MCCGRGDVLKVLEAVEAGLCLPEVPEVMRCVLLCRLEVVGGWALFAGGVGGAGGTPGDVLCATLCAGGCGG